METRQHAELMDQIYRWQRHGYDATRKYYLFGRDRTIKGLGPVPEQASILEIGCGTGRNLRKALHHYPSARGFGVDISAQMLATASAALRRDGMAARVSLGRGDACNFNPTSLFQQAHFDRVLLPYCLSMMPCWEAALAHAMTLVAPGGSVHVVDFGQQERFPRWARQALHAWLTRFAVTPRTSLVAVFDDLARRAGLQEAARQDIGGGYAVMLKAIRRGN